MLLQQDEYGLWRGEGKYGFLSDKRKSEVI